MPQPINPAVLALKDLDRRQFRECAYFPDLPLQNRIAELLNVLVTVALLQIPNGNGGEVDATITSTVFSDVTLPDYVLNLTVINDGPDSIVVRIPRARNAEVVTVRPSEIHSESYSVPVINAIALALASGGTSASVRVQFNN